MEDSAMERTLKRNKRLKDGFLAGYLLLMVGLVLVAILQAFFGPPKTAAQRLGDAVPYIGTALAMAYFGQFFAGRALVEFLFEHLPGIWRGWMYRGWHGQYRSFQDHHIRIIDGTDDSPSLVLAIDILTILGLPATRLDMEKLEARFGDGFKRLHKEDHPELAAGEWAFTDEACAALLTGHAASGIYRDRMQTAQKLLIWLAREVFMPIDNRRTLETGRNYRWTSTGRHGNS